MTGFRWPGPLGWGRIAPGIDVGTMCVYPSPPPGVVAGAHGSGPPPQHAHAQRRVADALRRGAASKLTDADFEDAAKSLGPGVSSALIHAFADVESGGRSGFDAHGRPVIAFEGHHFRKYTHRRFDHDHPQLSYKYVEKAGPEWKRNNKNSDSAWQTLEQALALDHEAALKACSWGMFQVMGRYYKECGYKTVDDFVAAMKAGEKGQLAAFVGYCKSAHGCVKAMQSKDFAAMATAYNGKHYGDYDKRIERAYKRHGGQ